MNKHYLIEKNHLDTICNISKRLYTENRLTADEMRDYAQALNAIAGFAESIGAIDVNQCYSK